MSDSCPLFPHPLIHFQLRLAALIQGLEQGRNLLMASVAASQKFLLASRSFLSSLVDLVCGPPIESRSISSLSEGRPGVAKILLSFESNIVIPIDSCDGCTTSPF
jgi:hypothetical protein